MSRPRLTQRLQMIEQAAERRQVLLTSERLAEVVGCTVAELEQGASDLARRFERVGARTHEAKIAFLANDNDLSEEIVLQAFEELVELIS